MVTRRRMYNALKKGRLRRTQLWRRECQIDGTDYCGVGQSRRGGPLLGFNKMLRRRGTARSAAGIGFRRRAALPFIAALVGLLICEK